MIPHSTSAEEIADLLSIVERDLHDSAQEPLIALVLQPVDGRDVGVIQGGEELGFTLEASQSVLVSGEVLRQNLDRHVTIQLRIPRPIHLARGARAERLENLIMA